MFITVVLSIWTLMNLYVSWRLAGLPLVREHVPLRWVLVLAIFMWLSYPLARILEVRGLTSLAYPLELLGAVWMGVFFLLTLALLLADVVTGFGLLLPRIAPGLRAGAALVGLLLGVVAVIQDLRGPAVSRYEFALAGLPAERDGTVLVEISDLHLGTLLGRTWWDRRVAQVEALKPDVVVVVGDLIDGNAARVERLVPDLRRLSAPLGVWAVTGNHEFYAGLDKSLKVFADAGFHTLRDTCQQVVPGLVFAGVDDLTARRQFNLDGKPVEKALGGCPAGATVFLSHTPWQAEKAAALGARLMLSGHTHDGQIWPFGYFVERMYPYIGGLYRVDGMPLIVCRGTGTWGPPLRLWRRSEIVRITLRSLPAARTS